MNTQDLKAFLPVHKMVNKGTELSTVFHNSGINILLNKLITDFLVLPVDIQI